jgi:diguanylate cyclase (GGDEF)-like protein
MDVDHFKRVNDQLGHQAGDAVLREIAARGAHVLQADELLGRYGGEEFLVVLPDADEARGVDLAEQVRAVIAAAPVRTPDGQVLVTASFGVATVRSAQSGAQELIAAADRALYEAKAKGRNQVVVAPSLALPTPASSESGDRARQTLTSRSGAGSEAATTEEPRAIRAA